MTVNNERAEAIRGIQAQMADYGLTMEELEAAGCFDPRPPPPPSAAGVLPQRRGDELGRAGRDAGLAAAGGQCGAERGVSPGRVTPPGYHYFNSGSVRGGAGTAGSGAGETGGRGAASWRRCVPNSGPSWNAPHAQAVIERHHGQDKTQRAT